MLRWALAGAIQRQPAGTRPRQVKDAIIARCGTEALGIARTATARTTLAQVFYGMRDERIRRPASHPARSFRDEDLSPDVGPLDEPATSYQRCERSNPCDMRTRASLTAPIAAARLSKAAATTWRQSAVRPVWSGSLSLR
jgi:hypothetical protein